MKLTVPQSWNEISIEQFQKLNKLNEANLEDQIDYMIQLVSICCKDSYANISKLSITQLRVVAEQLGFTKELPAQKKIESVIKLTRKYECMLSIEKISAGQYIDLKEYIKRGIVDNLHYIMTCFYIPEGENYAQSDVKEIANDFKENLSVGECYPIAVFFWDLVRLSMEDIQDYLVQETMDQIRKALALQVQTMPSTTIGAG